MANEKKSTRTYYRCDKCPAFCCSFYPRVIVDDDDVQRMANHYQISVEEAGKRFTKVVDGERVMRRRKDDLLGETCKFLDKDTRGCTIYEARPGVCRTFPAKARCALYDLWKFEEEQQFGRGRVIPLVQIRFPDEE